MPVRTHDDDLRSAWPHGHGDTLLSDKSSFQEDAYLSQSLLSARFVGAPRVSFL